MQVCAKGKGRASYETKIRTMLLPSDETTMLELNKIMQNGEKQFRLQIDLLKTSNLQTS